MTKKEIVLLVDRVLSTWTVEISLAQRRTTYESWHRIVEDLDYEECSTILDQIIIEDKPWPPRPGTLRRRVIDAFHTNDPPPPSPLQAWAEYRRNVTSATNGGNFEPLHPLVQATVKLAGAETQVLHTNGDREIFTKIYEEVLAEAEAERYGLK